MTTKGELTLIRRLINCVLKNGDCEMRREIREELKLLIEYLRIKKRRRRSNGLHTF